MEFSIIVCTHNPRPENFSKLLSALLRFDHLSPQHEVIIVDNNSSVSLSENETVRSFLSAKPNSLLIRETTPGLTAARLAGIRQARHTWVTFFDDDNEPASDYLKIGSSAIEEYEHVGAWGPGTLRVVYTENSDSWLETRKALFQERYEPKTIFAKEKAWRAFYPYGTGLIIRSDIARAYAQRVTTGRNTLTDRKGKSLTSGGDVQLVLTAIEMGYAAGTVAGLSLNHLIDSSKANLAYLQRQQYGTASAYITAHNQVFRESQIVPGRVSNYSILKSLYSWHRIHHSGLSTEDFKLLIATKMGEMNAAALAKETPKPFLLKLYERMIDV